MLKRKCEEKKREGRRCDRKIVSNREICINKYDKQQDEPKHVNVCIARFERTILTVV